MEDNKNTRVVLIIDFIFHYIDDKLYFRPAVTMAAKAESKDDNLTSTCNVCGSPAAAHLHYGAVSCYSCRAFFRRGQPKQTRYASTVPTIFLKMSH